MFWWSGFYFITHKLRLAEKNYVPCFWGTLTYCCNSDEQAVYVMLQSVMKWVKLNFKIHIQYLLDLGARLDSKWANGGDLCAPHSVTVLPFSSILYRWKVEFSGTQHDEGPTLMAHKQGLELTQIIWVCSDILSFFFSFAKQTFVRHLSHLPKVSIWSKKGL